MTGMGRIGQLKMLLQTFRPAFLVLTPVCVLLGVSVSAAAGVAPDPLLAGMALAGALAAHISVNALNEYFDFRNGLDLATIRTPFSGGSGVLPRHPELAPLTLRAGLMALGFTLLVGLYLLGAHGARVLPFGLAGALLVLTYTQWINRWPLACLVAPGAGFGLLVVLGTGVLLMGQYDRLAGLASLVPFFLVNNLLLLNQYPDAAADAAVGRRTFPVAYGFTASSVVYALFTLAAAVIIVALPAMEHVSVRVCIALIPLGFAVYALVGAVRHAAAIGRHPRYLAANVLAALLTTSVLAGELWRAG